MNEHKLTPVQRKVLRWMKEAEGQVTFITGHKNTRFAHINGEDYILCQSLVPYFLEHHGYIEKADGIGRRRLTGKGRSAV